LENLDYKHLMNVSRIGKVITNRKMPTDDEIWALRAFFTSDSAGDLVVARINKRIIDEVLSRQLR
jgi:DNA-directed RNA polymerase specialized sigma54-like protein